MTPLEYYRKRCQQDSFIEDANQLDVLVQLQSLYEQLLIEQKKRSGFFSLFTQPVAIQGLYLWGGVGIGKTFIMDCLYHCIPFPEKMRMHFHQFMNMVHLELKKQEGNKDPLQVIGKNIARKTMLLCFDEFHVSDIADAMILARLLDVLFTQGVCLMATSNSKPDDLYKNGLQRSRFLPAIAMLKAKTTVVHVPTTVDYRLRYLRQVGVFYTPNDHIAHENMEKSFTTLAHGKTTSYEPILINDRVISVVKRADDIIWFDFNVICTIPRSQLDYIAIAKAFKTVFISNIPIIAVHSNNIISLFIRLVDVFYDARIRLVFSAEKPLDQIYQQGYLAADFQRTYSRLQEMQSASYFADPPH